MIWERVCLKLDFPGFLSILLPVFVKILESQVLSFISNPAPLLSYANTLLRNFNPAISNMLWFLIVIANNYGRFIC